MKKMLNVMLAIGMIQSVSGGCNASEDKKYDRINSAEIKHSEFKQFISEIISLETIFREAYEVTRQNVVKLLENEQTIDTNFKITALQDWKKTKRKLEAFGQIACKFQGSPDINVRELTKACLELQEYANGILEQHYNIIISPQEYLDSEENLRKLTEYTALFKEQYAHLGELLQSIGIA